MGAGYFEKWAVVSRLHDGTERFQLLQDLVYHTDCGSRYIVPRGFKTDLASIPKMLWNIYPPHGLYLSASILHDYLCENDWMNRKDGDNIFLEAMSHSNVSRVTRTIIYFAVRFYATIFRIE
ncbi:DUF1353 domain-containing protein [bacterium]|nr:DUF1353 domain-containing protein [bacterium]